MNRRDFIKTAAAGAGLAAQAPQNPPTTPAAFELDEMTVVSLQEAMRSGRLTSRAVTGLYLDRIDALDRSGPALRSVIEINPRALDDASSLDAERKSRGPRGPLHGIPVLLKDNINTAGPMMTTAGSLALEGSIPPREATIARRLREAGAVVLGKANMSEWANFRSTRSTSGWSARGGQCRNPYVLDRSPLGSSSGSAVAVAANLCAVSVGTETDGSIVFPASVCGVVGVKPTVGLLSTEGIVPIAHSQDAPGPVCRTVADAAVLLGAMQGGADYTRFLDSGGLKNARIGVARRLFLPDPEVERLMSRALDTMKALGAEFIDLDDFRIPELPEIEVLLYEFKANLNAYFKTLAEPHRSLTLRAVIDFNERNRDRELLFFGQELFLMAESKGPLTEKAYLDALALSRRRSRDEGIDAVMAKYKLQAIVAPTSGPAEPIAPGRGDRISGRAAVLPAVAGYPHITVPAGFVGRLPVGLSFFGSARSEATLLRFAFAFEEETEFRRRPTFTSTP